MTSVGRVIGTTTLKEYHFVIKKGQEAHVKKDEFVTVKETVTGHDILGVIKDITITNELLPDEFGRDLRLADYILAEGEYPLARVAVLGHETPDGLAPPRHGIAPAGDVALAEDAALARILAHSGPSLEIGCLATRPAVPLTVNANDLVGRHCAVLAMTGAGKSYTVGVLIEELMEKHASIVVFDPHGEYRNMRFTDASVKVFAPGGPTRLTIEAASLTRGDFAALIPDLTATQQDLLEEITAMAARFYEKYDLRLLLKVLSHMHELKKGGKDKNHDPDVSVFPEKELRGIIKKVGFPTIGGLARRIRRLDRMRIFSVSGTRTTDIAAPNQLTVIDLSDADTTISETVISVLARSIFHARRRHVKAESYGGDTLAVPVYLIVEEAHNFIPRGCLDERPVLSRGILRRIAREGRKFGVGLCIVSQRPGKLDADVLSQCNTQIIMRIVNPADQEYIRQSVESVTEDIVYDLPGLARGQAIVAGSAVPVAVPTRIRERTTQEGGADIDAVAMWEQAASERLVEGVVFSADFSAPLKERAPLAVGSLPRPDAIAIGTHRVADTKEVGT